MLVTELHTHQIPEVYRRFSASIGESHWKRCVAQQRTAIKGNEFLRDYVEDEYDIPIQLNRLGELIDRFGTVPAETEQGRLYPAASLAAQVLSLMDNASRMDAEKLRRRIHGALKNPADMRGLRLELSAATHFARRGMQISWPETTGIGTFDLLVENNGQPSLEVECKSIADDKGRKIHKLEVLEFLSILKPHLKPTTTGLARGLSVVLTVPSRLPSKLKEREALAKAFGRAIFKGCDCTLVDGSTVRLSDFDVAQLGNTPPLQHPQEMRRVIDGVTGTNNRQAVLIGTAAGGALAIALQSSRDDNLLKAVFDTLSDASSRQLTGKRAGLLIAGFDGIDGEQMLSIAQQDKNPLQPPTALRIAVSKFLSAASRSHIVGVGFLSRGSFSPIQSGLSDSSGGTAYYFPKQNSSFWSDSFSELFTWAS